MTDYDDLFDDVAAADSVFADKGALDPLADPDGVVARNDQEQALVNVRSGVHEGVSAYHADGVRPAGHGQDAHHAAGVRSVRRPDP